MAALDEASVRHLYLDEAKSIRAVAAVLHVAPRTVYDAMILWHIPRRPPWETRLAHNPFKAQLNEPLLRRLYIEEGKSIRTIARELSLPIRTVSSALVQWGIPRRHGMLTQNGHHDIAHSSFNEHTLRQLYITEGKTLHELAELFQVSYSTIRSHIIRCDIELRRRGPH